MEMDMKRSIAGLVVVMLLGAPNIYANETQQQITQFRTMLEKHAEEDKTGSTTADREMAMTWLKEAELLQANGDREAAKRRLRRVEASLDLIRALSATMGLRAAAEEQEAAAHKAPETLAALKAEIEELQRKKQTLQRELETLR
jgi:hypothetical protein